METQVHPNLFMMLGNIYYMEQWVLKAQTVEFIGLSLYTANDIIQNNPPSPYYSPTPGPIPTSSPTPTNATVVPTQTPYPTSTSAYVTPYYQPSATPTPWYLP
jgi:hypothetical protein